MTENSSKSKTEASMSAVSVYSLKDNTSQKAEVRITVSAPGVAEIGAIEDFRKIKATDGKKKSTIEIQYQDEPAFSSYQRLGQCFEKSWIWIFSLTLVLSILLSIGALSSDDSSWLESSQVDDKSRVGWRLACTEHKEQPNKLSSSATMQTNRIFPCGINNATAPVADVVDTTSGHLGYAIFGVILGSWLLPILIVICSNYIRRTRGTCCHGFTVSGVWLVTGIALFALTVSFKYSINNHLSSNYEIRYSVTCTNYGRDISLCSNVRDLDTCASKCRVIQEGRIVCAEYQSCELDQRKTTCIDDGIGCTLDPSWAFYSSIGCAISFLFMGLVLAFGSLSVSKDL